MANNYVCSVCGHEQDSMQCKCDGCGSYRVVTLDFVKKHFGEDWKKQCFGNETEEQKKLRIYKTLLEEAVSLGKQNNYSTTTTGRSSGSIENKSNTPKHLDEPKIKFVSFKPGEEQTIRFLDQPKFDVRLIELKGKTFRHQATDKDCPICNYLDRLEDE